MDLNQILTTHFQNKYNSDVFSLCKTRVIWDGRRVSKLERFLFKYLYHGKDYIQLKAKFNGALEAHIWSKY